MPESLILMCVVQLSIPQTQVYREVEVQEVLHGNVHLTIDCCEHATHYLAGFTSLEAADLAIRRARGWMTARGVHSETLERRQLDADYIRKLDS